MLERHWVIALELSLCQDGRQSNPPSSRRPESTSMAKGTNHPSRKTETNAPSALAGSFSRSDVECSPRNRSLLVSVHQSLGNEYDCRIFWQRGASLLFHSDLSSRLPLHSRMTDFQLRSKNPPLSIPLHCIHVLLAMTGQVLQHVVLPSCSGVLGIHALHLASPQAS